LLGQQIYYMDTNDFTVSSNITMFVLPLSSEVAGLIVYFSYQTIKNIQTADIICTI